MCASVSGYAECIFEKKMAKISFIFFKLSLLYTMISNFCMQQFLFYLSQVYQNRYMLYACW